MSDMSQRHRIFFPYMKYFWEGQNCNCNQARPRVADSGLTIIDIEARSEISGNLPTNEKSRTNSGLSTRLQEAGGWHHHPYETLQIHVPYDGEVIWRVQAANQ